MCKAYTLAVIVLFVDSSSQAFGVENRLFWNAEYLHHKCREHITTPILYATDTSG